MESSLEAMFFFNAWSNSSTFDSLLKPVVKFPLRISTEERRKITLFTWKNDFFFFQNKVRDVLIMNIVMTDK